MLITFIYFFFFGLTIIATIAHKMAAPTAIHKAVFINYLLFKFCYIFILSVINISEFYVDTVMTICLSYSWISDYRHYIRWALKVHTL